MEQNKKIKTLVSILGSDIRDEAGTWVCDEWTLVRVAAGERLYKSSPETTVLVVHSRNANKDRPTVAKIVSRYLIAHGVPQSSLILEEVSITTHQQLMEFQKIVNEIRPDAVRIISNEWHLPRINTFLEYVPELFSLRERRPHLVSAEEILLREGPQWKGAISALRQNPATEIRSSLEKKGIAQIIDGTYQYR